MTVSMDLEFTLGRMVDSMKAIGITANNMEKEYTDNLLALNVVANGRRVSVLLG